jgi:hypothetical protein
MWPARMKPTVAAVGFGASAPATFHEGAGSGAALVRQMESCQPRGEIASSTRPFLVAAYLPDQSGAWLPSVMLTACPAGDEATCRIRLDHWRTRKTGPRCPVAVLACATHGCRFTLYPCGHVPYGREAVAPVGLDGAALTSAAAQEPAGRWRQTRFDAVLDAAQGKAWPRSGPGPCWTTQLSRLDELAALLGLAADSPPGLGEKLARLLDLPRLSLIDASRELALADGYRERGSCLVATLERATSCQCVLERVLACGALAGLWRPVHWWRPVHGRPRRQVFPGRGTPSG